MRDKVILACQTDSIIVLDIVTHLYFEIIGHKSFITKAVFMQDNVIPNDEESPDNSNYNNNI